MRTRIVPATAANIERLARTLRRGGVVAVPTETVYGLAANALDEAACARIFEIKGRPSSDPLIVHVHSRAAAEKVAVFNEEARRLAGAFWPGPLTMVLPKRECIPGIVTAGLDSVAVRVPRHKAFRSLLSRAGLPLAAPSANPFGYVSPTSARHVCDNLGGRIACILDGGPCRVGLESTIVDLRRPKAPRILRPGWITAEDIENETGLRVLSAKPRSATKASIRREPDVGLPAPGMMTKHYSPRTPLRLVKKIGPKAWREHAAGVTSVAWIHFARPATLPPGIPRENVFWLSRDGNVAEAARRLFGTLRQIDAKVFDLIVAELAPAAGAGESLNDRLRRAAAKS
ncbi:MAG: threonylcarbamoyl-AMP synthase [Opitutaceae bacterium]|nr:threonylcarbamoyl-AMP synthase [Opitutaceae bacterium]